MTQRQDLHDELQHEFEIEARDIKARARQRGQKYVDDARRMAAEQEENVHEHVERELAIERRRALSRAEIEGRNTLLNTRREAIDGVIADVRQTLRDMSRDTPQRYCELLWTFYTAGRKLLPGKTLRVRFGPDAESCRKRLENEEGVEAEKDSDITGLILESDDRRLRCDFTWDHLLLQLRRDREAEIAALLFEEEHE